MVKIAIFSKSVTGESVLFLNQLVQLLLENNAVVFIHQELRDILTAIAPDALQYFNANSPLSDIDFIISIGGDGTFLESVLYGYENDIPILGINSGRMGFLAEISIEEVSNAIDQLLHFKFNTEIRTLIEIKNNNDKHFLGKLPIALNEFAITKGTNSSMIVVHAHINGEFVNSYWADGLIISTPTGSTGYSMSCGGPIIAPSCHNFIITPVSPHNLNVRPLVVSDDSVISLSIEGRSKDVTVSLDSRSWTRPISEAFTLAKAGKSLKIIKPFPNSFFEILRTKLFWGKDLRN